MTDPVLVQVVAADERDVDRAVRPDRRIDERVARRRLRRRGQLHGLRERRAAIARHGDHDLPVAIGAVEGRPHRVDVVLVDVPGDVVDGDPLLVLDVTEGEAVLVVRPVERITAVALDPVTSEVVGVGHVDLAVRMHPAFPECVERERRLVHASLRVEVDVRVGVVRPARRHVLRADGRALIALDLVRRHSRAVDDRVRPQVEVVERAPLADEELRVADDGLGARLDGQPGFRVVRVQLLRPAGARVRPRGAGRDGIAAAGHRRAHDRVRERHGSRARRQDECADRSERCDRFPHVLSPLWNGPGCGV